MLFYGYGSKVVRYLNGFIHIQEFRCVEVFFEWLDPVSGIHMFMVAGLFSHEIILISKVLDPVGN